MAICYMQRGLQTLLSISAIKFLFILALYNQLYGSVDGLGRYHHVVNGLGRQASLTTYFRQAPLCVDDSNMHPVEKGLERFTWVFQYLRFNTYIPVSDGKTSPTGMITKFELTTVDIDDVDSGYKDTLKNWVHIHVESAVELEGLYVQAFSSPWGIPFGEFIESFDCFDCSSKTSFFARRIHIVPCSYRSALSYEHPTVFTVGGDKIRTELGERRVFFQNMHFHFRYTQYPGVDHNFAQFLVIAVRNFNGNLTRFEPFFSSIYKLDVADNPSGAFHPFYDGWPTNFINCHNNPVSKDWELYTGANPKLKLRYSNTFDYCLRNKKNPEYITCEPGPIQMAAKDVPQTLPEWTALRAKYNISTGANDPYGKDGQFCNDGGTWEWSVGKPTWPVPPVEVVIEGDSLYLNESSLADMNLTVCGSMGGTDDCSDKDKSQTIVAENKEICGPNQNYHAIFCKDPPEPTYGKDPKTGEYTLNRVCWGAMNMTQQVQAVAIDWGNNFIFSLHGRLMVFAWTVGWNIMFFSARFMKEYSVIENKSSYFGIGEWLWHHIIWTYMAIGAMVSGLYLIGNQHQTTRTQNVTGKAGSTQNNLNDLCNIRTKKDEVEGCLNSTAHRYLGGIAAVLFMISYMSGWGRPQTPILRKFLIIYHYGFGYLGKLFFYILLVEGTLENPVIIPTVTFVLVSLMDVVSFVMFVSATGINAFVDRKYAHTGEDKRKYFPVPEAIDILNMPSKPRMIFRCMLYVHILLQLALFFIVLPIFASKPASSHSCD